MRSDVISILALTMLGCGGPEALATDGGSTRDAVSTGSDAASDAGAAPSLATLPFDSWSYVPFPGAVCGNGSTAAIGVNPHEGATSILVVIEGGGACWDADTCFVRNGAVHTNEDYTRAIFDTSVATITAAGIDDRNAATNAFRAFHLVFVPYCTGDLHAGNADHAYDPAQPTRRMYHHGSPNMQAYIAAMHTAWPSLTNTLVLGFSAGGYGAQLNWGHFADAWPSDSLLLLADCSPLVQSDGALYTTWRTAWNMDTPSDCADCATTFAAYDDYFDARHPDTRFGLLATTRDAVVSTYFGISDMPARILALEADHLDDNATTRYFVADTDDHVLLDDVPPPAAVDGTVLGDWVAGFLANDTTRWHDTHAP